MNEHPNSEHTGEDRSDLEKRYAKARNISVVLFVFGVPGFLVGLVLPFIAHEVSSLVLSVLSVFLLFGGVYSVLKGFDYSARALVFREKLPLGTTDSITDTLFIAIVKLIIRNLNPNVLTDQMKNLR